MYNIYNYIILEYNPSHILLISLFLANSTRLVLTRQSGQAKLLTLPSYSVWQFRRRSHFPGEPLTHDFARFWIPCGKEPLRTCMYMVTEIWRRLGIAHGKIS